MHPHNFTKKLLSLIPATRPHSPPPYLSIIASGNPAKPFSLIVLWALSPEHENRANHPRLHLLEILPQRILKLICVIILVVEHPMVLTPLPDLRREEIILPDALAQDIGAGDDAVGRHVVLDVVEDAALLRHGHGQAVEKVVHADGVELLADGEGLEDIGDEGVGIGPVGPRLRHVERTLLVVDQRQACRGGHAAFAAEVVAGANADVQVVAAHVGAEEREQVARRATAPGKGVDDAEHPQVVEEEQQRRVDRLALLGRGGGIVVRRGGSNGWFEFLVAVLAVGKGRGCSVSRHGRGRV